jgi:hypothetical protein
VGQRPAQRIARAGTLGSARLVAISLGHAPIMPPGVTSSTFTIARCPSPITNWAAGSAQLGWRWSR